MIGTYPMATLAPLDYRYALDSAMPLLAGKKRATRLIRRVWIFLA